MAGCLGAEEQRCADKGEGKSGTVGLFGESGGGGDEKRTKGPGDVVDLQCFEGLDGGDAIDGEEDLFLRFGFADNNPVIGQRC